MLARSTDMYISTYTAYDFVLPDQLNSLFQTSWVQLFREVLGRMKLDLDAV